MPPVTTQFSEDLSVKKIMKICLFDHTFRFFLIEISQISQTAPVLLENDLSFPLPG